MAITKTTSVQRMEVYPAQDNSAENTTNAGNTTLMVVYVETFDDSGDAKLPVSTQRVVHLYRYSDEEAGTATDISGEDALVQTVCGAIWT
ncbi:MAG: hypothetical protein CML17_11020 [Pusillimonas sp.]|nr:hypothetical protein [Pusillimonas sp.]